MSGVGHVTIFELLEKDRKAPWKSFQAVNLEKTAFKDNLKRGDLLFFYTDGFSEAMDEEMNPFGEERLMQSLSDRQAGTLDDVANGILGDIRRYVGGAEQYDDMTFLLLKVE